MLCLSNQILDTQEHVDLVKEKFDLYFNYVAKSDLF